MSGYPRPSELALHVQRIPLEGRCEACGAEALARYPVLSEGGWFDVTKCQECLVTASRERSSPLGPIALLVDAL